MNGRAKPRHLGADYAAQFRDRALVRAYAARPPYPDAVFAALRSLLPQGHARALEIGCGSGDLTFRLAEHVSELVAIDPSPPMLAAAVERRAEVPRNIHFVLASAEDFAPHGKFGLVVAAESLHWMEWSIVLPKLAACLGPEGKLAIVLARGWLDLPWETELRRLLAFHSTNQDYKPYDLVEELAQRGLFVEHGRTRCVNAEYRQDVAGYIESFHARNGFSRERMGLESAAAFDSAVRELVLRHRPQGVVSGALAASVVWGSVGNVGGIQPIRA
jgi:SAM-dependent methyltransferase